MQRHDSLALEAEAPDRALTGAGNLIAVLVALVGSRAFIHAPHVHQLLEVAVIDVLALALVVGSIVAAPAFAFIPIQPEPFHAGEDSLHGIFHMAFLVGVFDTQDECATHLAGKEVIEEGGAGSADVQIAGRGGCKACADIR